MLTMVEYEKRNSIWSKQAIGRMNRDDIEKKKKLEKRKQTIKKILKNER